MNDGEYICNCEECIWHTSVPMPKDIAEGSMEMHMGFVGHTDVEIEAVPDYPECPVCDERVADIVTRSDGMALLGCVSGHRYVYDSSTGETYYNGGQE